MIKSYLYEVHVISARLSFEWHVPRMRVCLVLDVRLNFIICLECLWFKLKIWLDVHGIMEILLFK